MSWDPKLFDQLDLYRRRPAYDLAMALRELRPTSIVDLGCGGGHLARVLAASWPEAEVVGVDNSPAMLNWAAGTPSRVRYLEADVTTWRPSWPVDLLISDGGLQRVDDHPRLFPELLETLAPGGTLAVTMPRAEEVPAHRLLLETALDGPWASRLADAVRPMAAHAPADYYDWLSPLATDIDIWETEYLQVLRGEPAVLQWVHAMALAPVVERLEEPDLSRFLTAYRSRLEDAYPQHPSGCTLIPMRRLFIVARVADAESFSAD